MVQLTAPARPGPLAAGLSLLVGLGAVALGVGLLRETESAFGATWASLFLVCGVVVLASLVTVLPAPSGPPPAPRQVTWEGEPARFFPRRNGRARSVGLAVLTLLGGWFAALGIVGAIEENWIWPVLAAVPAVYFLGFPVLAALGRFRAAGVWLTPTRVVDEQHGLRSELALAEVAVVTPRSQSVHVTPNEPAAVTRRRLTPWPWRARPRSTDLVIATDGVAGGSDGLAADVRAAAAGVRR